MVFRIMTRLHGLEIVKRVFSITLTVASSVACNSQNIINKEQMYFKVRKTEEQWKKELTLGQYRILRHKGTERPFTGKYNLHFEDGIYACAGCNAKLFSGDSKFESNCGWPSFDKALDENKVIEKLDRSHGMTRTEILCANCGGHLGHVFNDGPTETGMRYCINSASLDFKKAGEEKAENK